MNQISFIKSLMEFNKRVLYQGKIFLKNRYSFNELNNKLFFNKVFISNTQEMFQKYDTRSIVDDYIDEVSQYIRNVNLIIKLIMFERNDIRLSREDSFERRLSIENKIANQIISKTFKSINDIKYDSFKFINNYIYYLSFFDDGNIMISYIDIRSSVYQNIISCQMDGYKIYWKTDDCVRDYIRERYNAIDTIAIRITIHEKKNYISKVEYNGETSVMRKLISMFPNALIISNPFIYIDDIEMIINENNDIKPPIMKSKFTPLTLDYLFKNDLLIEYPNDSFDEYLQFLSLASKNKGVKSIYITLYRVGKDPAIFYILRDAVANGIKVYVNIELCASGESINLLWLNEMKRIGINVYTYEVGRLKVHCKLTLIEFSNGSSLCQVGTGNYHTQTSSQYTDLSIITSDNEICQQVKKVFKLLKGKYDPDDLCFNKSLLVTRYNARDELIYLIDQEAEKGDNGYIMIKCNSLDDEEFNIHLENAAIKKCKIDLVVRGVCTWIPRKIDSNVKIKSVVWDKLEHSRVFCFGKHNPKIYIGSLDITSNKINNRIETLVLIKDPDIIIKLCEYLNRYVTNTSNSWIQTSSGMYIKE